MTPLQKLEQLAFDAKLKKYPDHPYLVRPKFTDKNANELTKSIIAFIKLSGGHAERINTTGRVIDQRRTFIDVVGIQRTIGGVKWISGTGTPGSADISATIDGKSVKIEVKHGRDRQSEAQKKYQADIENSGGVYYIARTFQGFYEWYQSKFFQINSKIEKSRNEKKTSRQTQRHDKDRRAHKGDTK